MQNKFKNKLLALRIFFWSLLIAGSASILISFYVLKENDSNTAYNILGFGGCASTFLLLFAISSSIMSFKEYKVENHLISIYVSFVRTIILVDGKVVIGKTRGIFSKPIDHRINIGSKKIVITIGLPNDISVMVNGTYIPKIKKEKKR